MTVTVPKIEYDKLVSNHKNLTFDYVILKEELARLKRLVYGSKSERFTPSANGQLSLFEDDPTQTTEEEKQEVSYTRRKKKISKKIPVRLALPSHLPRVEEVIEPKEIEEGSVRIGELVTEILEYNPSHIFVRKIIRPKYANPNNSGVQIGELPSLPIPKGNAGPGLLAHVLVSKYVDHLPFYRQISIFKRNDLSISSSTLGGWFMATAKLLNPLYEVLEKQITEYDYLQVDESPIGVQDSNKKKSLHKGFMWVYNSPVKGLVLFKYSMGRSSKAPKEVLEKFSGSIQTDGYAAYQKLKKEEKNINLIGCMAHARRYFEKAIVNDASRAEHALVEIQKLYVIERKARVNNVSYQTRKRYRSLYAKPILNKWESWLKENYIEVLPKSSIGVAIAYSLRLIKSLKEYIKDGRYEIDNNLIENTIRPLALGRKNYMFAGSHQAAQNAAIMYSLFASCKVNNVNPFAWLKDVLEKIPDYKINKIQELLPSVWEAD